MFYFDLFGLEWLMEELRHMNGNSPMPASKCYIVMAFLSFLPHTSGCSFVASLLSRLYA